MMDAGRHPRIQLLVNSEVEDVTGFVGNYPRHRAPACPVRRRLRVHLVRRLRRRLPGRRARRVSAGPVVAASAIYLPFPQAVPSSYFLDARELPGLQPDRLRQVPRGLRQEVHRLRRPGRAARSRGRHDRRRHRHGALRPAPLRRVRLHPLRQRRHLDGVRAPDLRRRPQRRASSCAPPTARCPNGSASSSASARARPPAAFRTAPTSAA